MMTICTFCNEGETDDCLHKVPISSDLKLKAPLPGGGTSGSSEKLRGTKILFCGCGSNCFLPLGDTNSKATHYLPPYVLAQYTKRNRKSSLDLFEAEHHKRHHAPKSRIFNSRGTTSILVLFIRDSSLPGGGGGLKYLRVE